MQSDEHFGVISSGPAPLVADRLNTLGVTWYLDYSSDPSTAPPGVHKVLYVNGKPEDRLSVDHINGAANAQPGSWWLIGGELNTSAVTPAQYLSEFEFYVSTIKAADPTAKILSAGILNWDFTCSGCGGFRSGESWLKEFVDRYQANHGGALPPVDAWAIDVYPLTWDRLPMTDWLLAVDQIRGLREYLNNELFQFGASIWVTEVASHWAYSAWVKDPSDGRIVLPGSLDWGGSYLWDDMETYLVAMLNWLSVNSGQLRIDRWFFYRDYIAIGEHSVADPYAGLYMFASPEEGAPLNRLGRVYREFATGER